MKTNFFVYIILLLAYLVCVQSAKAENIHFNNDVYVLKSSQISTENKGYENEYFQNNETKDSWTKMIGIYYLPEKKDPINYANDEDKKIETKENVALIKFIENKKQDKALISYLENGEENGKKFFEYNLYKYEKHPTKGMMVLRFAKKYFFKTNEEITKIGQEVKKINDDLMEQFIITSIPPIVEKSI